MANEKRFIDANALMEMLQSFTMVVTGLRAGKGVLSKYAEEYRKNVLRTIDETPTVDAVEVVRCKDCTKRETVLCPLETYDDFPWRASREDDFCSYGERREGE